MKKKNTAILLALILSMTAAVRATAAAPAAAPAAPAAQPASQAAQENVIPDKYHVEIEEVGRVDRKSGYRVNYDSLLRLDGTRYTFCDFKGNPVDDRALQNMDYLGWGLYSVTVQIDNDINSTGLVNAEGEVLIPFDAAIIKFPYQHTKAARPRYVLVFKGTGLTSDQKEALFFATDRQFAIMANDDDMFYKGTLQVYDLEARQYVSGLEFAHGSDSSFAQVGDNILVDVDGKATIYTPDGKTVYTEKGSLYYNYKYFMDRVDGQSIIMDANANVLCTTPDILNQIDYESEYWSKYNNSQYTAINSKGEPVLDGVWYSIYGETKDRFRVKNVGDADYSLVAKDNSVIASGPNMFEADPLGYQCFGETKNYTVVTPGNRIYEGLEESNENLVFTKDDDAYYLVLNTGEFASANDCDLDDVGRGVIALENDDDKYAAIDAFTGKELLGFEYDEIDDINGDYFYAKDGDEIIIYKIVIVAE